ncbi:MAG: hypothetical protein HY826_14335 [Actinobacteria bacterium]|nr:hypothetical protein [Actinomycetota bacterium]
MRRIKTRLIVAAALTAAVVVGGGQAAAAASPASSGVCAQRPAAPPIPGEFVVQDFVVFVDSAGVMWFKLFPVTPWGATPPSEWFSDYVQVTVQEPGAEFPTFFGFQTHAGRAETYSGSGATVGPPIEGYIMNDGALLFNSGLRYAGGSLNVNLNSGYLPTEQGKFQNSTSDRVVEAAEIPTSDDAVHFDDEFPVYDLTTGTPVDPPVVVVETTTTSPPTVTTEPATVTTQPTTQERPRQTTTTRRETCWWCWAIVLLFVAFLLCVLWTWLKTYEWWTCWLPWFLVIFIWVPFFFAGAWWWRPAWWWVPLLGWFPIIVGYAWYWARHRSWWRPWHWYLVGGYLIAAGIAAVIVGDPEWGLLFPVFWLPWVAFYMWYRARRQPWWRQWMYLLFGAYTAWIFVWVVWLTLWWAWWLPVVFVAMSGWWFATHGHTWSQINRSKWCWLIPFALLPFFAWWIPLWEPWWCFIIAIFLVETLLCFAFTNFRTETWWTWWLPLFIVVFVWVPFLLAGLWFFRPAWWGWALVPWFVAIPAYTYWWARRRSWWKPWMWFPVAGYLLAAGIAAVIVGNPEWGLLFPVFWLPWVGLYVWYRARRQPWWQPWMFLLFAGFAAWILVWVVWQTPWWGWWFPIVFVLFAGWWFFSHGYDLVTVRHKLCWILPWATLPWLCYMVALECVVTTG